MAPYAEIVLKTCMGVQKQESLLIVTDEKLAKLAHQFVMAGKNITPDVAEVEVPVPGVHGTEPPMAIAKQLLNYDVALLITSKSLSHTLARKNASDYGVRIATMPGITEEMAARCLDIDYDELAARNDIIKRALDRGNDIHITTEQGTDLHFSIAGRDGIADSGIYTKAGAFGNLPAGEVFLAPIEGTAHGTLVIDASMASIGKLDAPITVTVEKGLVSAISGPHGVSLLEKLDSVGTQGRNIAEFGIGTNTRATITGKVLEDEKVFGTCHIAFGNNAMFGGTVNVPLHLDGVITRPTIEIDKKKLFDRGTMVSAEWE